MSVHVVGSIVAPFHTEFDETVDQHAAHSAASRSASQGRVGATTRMQQSCIIRPKSTTTMRPPKYSIAMYWLCG